MPVENIGDTFKIVKFKDENVDLHDFAMVSMHRTKVYLHGCETDSEIMIARYFSSSQVWFSLLLAGFMCILISYTHKGFAQICSTIQYSNYVQRVPTIVG